MKTQVSVNELSNLVCDVFDEEGIDYDFDKVESTIGSLDDDIFDELEQAVRTAKVSQVISIVFD